MVFETKAPLVLIVEDDRDIAAYYRHVMDLAGYRTEIASNGQVALDYLFKSLPDIVLLDLSLPGVSGAEILRIVKSDARLKKTHAVVITGYSLIAADLSLEPDLVLLKPVSPSQLTDLVSRLCQDDVSMEKHPFGKSPWDKNSGLYNRSFFIRRLGSAISNARESGKNRFAVLLVSPDQEKNPQFKPEKNHQELFLREVAKSLKASVRPTDTISRFDHENFFILVENIDSSDIVAMIAGRIQQELGRHPAMGQPFSIGAVFCDRNCNYVDEIIKDVKAARSQARTEAQTHFKIFGRA
jgi:diguanylate cyclase (GGDEF)-like protein